MNDVNHVVSLQNIMDGLNELLASDRKWFSKYCLENFESDLMADNNMGLKLFSIGGRFKFNLCGIISSVLRDHLKAENLVINPVYSVYCDELHNVGNIGGATCPECGRVGSNVLIKNFVLFPTD